MSEENKKTIDELCNRPPGSFRKHIAALDVAAKLGLARPRGSVTLTADEVSALFETFPELEKLSVAALAQP